MNFFPIKVRQSKTRIEGKGDFTRHMLTFRHTNDLNGLQTVGDEVAELLLINSHDRSSAYNFHAGIFRFVCENGMIVKDSDFGSFKIRHVGDQDFKQQVIDATYKIVEDTPKVMGQIDRWKGITLQPAQRLAFAEAATELLDNKSVKPAQLLSAPKGSRYQVRSLDYDERRAGKYLEGRYPNLHADRSAKYHQGSQGYRKGCQLESCPLGTYN